MSNLTADAIKAAIEVLEGAMACRLQTFKILRESGLSPEPREGMVATEQEMQAVIATDTALSCMRECAERRENKPLTVEELRARHGKPIFYVSLPAWPLVDDECYEIRSWGLCEIACGIWDSALNRMPWWWNERNYGEWWLAYDHEPERSDT